jgi:type III pantothenate kinase
MTENPDHTSQPSATSINMNHGAASSSLPEKMSTFIAVAVGNTRTRVGVIRGTECAKAQSIETTDTTAIASYAASLFDEFDFASEEPVILMSTVSHESADRIETAIHSRLGWSSFRFGRDLQIPIRHSLTSSGEQTVGQDRLLCAVGAFDVVKQACVVVDMGTAITADFVDGEGVFHGGAILPGVSMMLDSMHAHTDSLPELKFRKLDPNSSEPGKQTDDAMILGVSAAVSGAIRFLAERYAQFYEGYPQILATGGDMGLLEDDELIESFVPDLQLHGIRVACAMVLDADADHELDDFDSEHSDSQIGDSQANESDHSSP